MLGWVILVRTVGAREQRTGRYQHNRGVGGDGQGEVSANPGAELSLERQMGQDMFEMILRENDLRNLRHPRQCTHRQHRRPKVYPELNDGAIGNSTT